MVNLVNLENVSKAYGPHVLLRGVSAGVAAGERIGVVGRNGSGKTTLMSVLAKVTQPDSGRVTHARGLRVGFLPQHDGAKGTVREMVLGVRPDHDWASDARARGVMSALLPGIGLDTAAARLSGGERRRAALAQHLVADPDLLVLDEPTNHLDLEAINWLAGHLRERGIAVVIVTHDRWLLDTVCEQTWEVADATAHKYDGGYSAYVLAKAERDRVAASAQRRRRSLLRKELAWLRRGPPARTSKPKFRLEAAAQLIADEPAPRDTVELARLATARLGRTVLGLQNLSVRIGERTVLDDVSWQLGPGDRVGLVGANGSGKTTLLRLLDGTLRARADRADRADPGDGADGGDGAAHAVGGHRDAREDQGDPAARQVGEETGQFRVSGRVTRGKTVRIGHLSQELTELDPSLRVIEAAAEVRRQARVGKRELSASQLLERLGFPGGRQQTMVADLSGGERRRLQLLRLLMNEPNVLLLDEPTNDLDVETLTEVEDLLDDWPGSLMVVSHDRYFLERVTDHVLALPGDGRLAFLGGGVDEYLAMIQAPASGEAAPAPVRSGGPPSGHRGAAGRARAARKELQQLERRLERLAAEETDVTTSMGNQASDYRMLLELGDRLRSLQQERSELEERWLALAEEVQE